jgi:squalene-hopene/tetraprenyl-beta-curcumene cyclase
METAGKGTRLVRRGLVTLAVILISAVTFSPRAWSADPPAAAPRTIPDAEKAAQIREARQRGVRWLLAQQGADGGWHSATYGQMRCGVGNTALALYALSLLPPAEREPHKMAIERGVSFLTSNLDAHGAVRAPDGESDYPNYATALGLIAMRRMGLKGPENASARMLDYVRRSQNLQTPVATNLEYGGWTHTAANEPSAPIRGETNLSVTRYSLAALAAYDQLDERSRQAGLAFLANCQNLTPPLADGGFYFTTTVDDPRNKAGFVARGDGQQPRSYGAPTVDGLLALRDCGLAENDPRVVVAERWLAANWHVDSVPGFIVGTPSDGYRDGLAYYYRAALAELLAPQTATSAATRRAELLRVTLAAQRPDGSWQNANPQMRENDPLLATPLALIALTLAAPK